MTMSIDHAPPGRSRSRQQEDEPWPIWAAILVFLNILVFSGMTFGLSGIVTVMVCAALVAIVLLLLIVWG